MGLWRKQPRADGQHHVGILPEPVPHRQVDRKAMRGRQHAAPAPVTGDRSLQQLGQRAHLRTGVNRAATHHDQRLFRRPQQFCRRLHRVHIQRRAGGRGGQGSKIHRPAPCPDIHAAFERHRALAARAGGGQRRIDKAGRFMRRVDARGKFRHMPRHAQLVVQFVQMPKAAINLIGRNLPQQRQHRRIQSIGVEQRRRTVQKSRSRHHSKGLRSAGRQRRPQRHIGRRLLVPRVQHTQPVLCAVQRVKQRIIVQAGQAEDLGQAMVAQALHQGLACRHHLRHDYGFPGHMAPDHPGAGAPATVPAGRLSVNASDWK